MCFSIKINTSKNNFITESKNNSINVSEIKETALELNTDSFIFRAFPHQTYPVIIKNKDYHELKLMNYSLIPSWSKTAKPKFATYNARVETIDEKPTWIKPLEKTRCLVPITSFFESCYGGTHGGHIVEFSSKDIIFLAGVYNTWIDKVTGEVVDSFAVVTKEPYPFVAKTGHDRSPIYLENKVINLWLDNKMHKISDVKNFLLHQHEEPFLEVAIERKLKNLNA